MPLPPAPTRRAAKLAPEAFDAPAAPKPRASKSRASAAEAASNHPQLDDGLHSSAALTGRAPLSRTTDSQPAATPQPATKTRARTKKPQLYKVLMLNDDYTPMEFVVLVLQQFFRMDIEEATRVMLQVHQKGIGVCGVFSYEVAETKVNQVMDCARANQHPLQCTLEVA